MRIVFGCGLPQIFGLLGNSFSQLLNVHAVNDVRQTEIHTAEPLVSEPSAFEVELAIRKIKSHKSPGVVQTPEELFKAESKTIRYGNPKTYYFCLK
jgi:hypothetical protein